MKKLSLLMVTLLITLTTSAQNIRYVSETGTYANNGKSWATPKNNIQDAINDLVNNGLTGEVWVAAGTYTPTESTEASGGSTLYMSFKIPKGITVRGGFAPGLGAAKDGVNDNTTRPHQSYTSIGWFYRYHTILSGNLSSEAKFEWNNERQEWNASFYGNTYHVVWFATQGFDSEGRANPVNTEDPITTPDSELAVLEGCVVTGGNAHNNTVTGRTHNAYGGGIYMVAGAKVENCYVHNCAASRDGGGIYMDGGGYAAHVYVADCQALGIGVQNGYGGGVCVDGPSDKASSERKAVKTYLTRSGIAGCVGRMGGGVAYNTHNTDSKYNICASAVLITNNVATTEGGGIYVNRGAALSHVTVVRNRCNGTGITIGGMQTGRSGGIYVRDNANIANSVIWGNKCATNQDIQYASSRSASRDDLKPMVQFTMLSKSDHADWSGTTKYKVEKLSEYNDLAALTAAGVTKSESEAFPMFKNPSPTPGHIDNVGLQTITNLTAEGLPTSANDAPNKAYDWQVNSRSALTYRGVLTYDLDTEHITPSRQITEDILGGTFTARVTLGAYNSEAVSGLPYMYAEKDGIRRVFNFAKSRYEDAGGNSVDVSDASWKKVASVFIDPKQTDMVADPSSTSSWDNPFKFLPDVLHFVDAWWKDPAYDALFGQLDTINIYIKEGTIYNTSSHYHGHVRNATIDIPHLEPKAPANKAIYLNIIGSMDKSLTGTAVDMRDPVQTPTIIMGNIMEDYDLNAAHLVTFNGCHDVVFDGFQVRYANAKSTKLENSNTNGAAMTFTHNGSSCNDVQVKNVLVAGCTAVNGAAVWIDANSQDITFENCIFHNNEARQDSKTLKSIVYIGSGATGISFNHCDIIRNVGYAFENNGTMSINNSVVYANMSKTIAETNGQESLALTPFAVKGTVSGGNNMFDTQASDIAGLGQNNLSFNTSDATYPRFINSTKNAGVSQKGDITYYGRTASFEPTNVNPMVNAASYAGAHTTWGTDMSTKTTRDFGGLPDIGAIENHVASTDPTDPHYEGENANKDGQLRYGEVVYVRDYNTYNNDGTLKTTDTSITDRDGSSWSKAINGNGMYHMEMTVDVPDYEDQDGGGYRISYTTTGGATYYLALTSDGNSLTTTQNENNASLFAVTNKSGTVQPVGTIAGTDYSRRLRDIATNKYIVLNWNTWGTSASFGVKTTPSGNQANITITKDGTGYTLYFDSENSRNSYRRYLRYNSGIEPSNNKSTAWIFTRATKRVQTGSHQETTNENINGLQYAVNQQNLAFRTDGASESNKKVVYVGAGQYTNATGKAAGTAFTSAEIAKHLVSQPYAYEIKEGVDVYGGFPATGNPGMSERNPKENETILQPQTTNPTITYSLSAAVKLTNIGWNDLVKKNNGDEAVSVGRVLVQDENYETPTRWDGFTLRHGYLMTARMNNIGAQLGLLKPGNIMNAGGAGALLQENGILSNCVVKDNVILCSTSNTKMIKTGNHVSTKDGNGLYTFHMAGAGIFMNGTFNNTTGLSNGVGAIVENCVVANNQIINKAALSGKSETPENTWAYGFGIYQNGGQIYNTIIHDNIGATIEGNVTKSSFGTGSGSDNEMYLGGVFVASGKFYNNTVVNNMATTLYGIHDNHCCFAGIHVFDKARIYNSVIADNISHWSYESSSGTDPGNGIPVSAFTDTGADRNSRDPNKVWVSYSYIDVNVDQMSGSYRVDLVSQNDAKTKDAEGNDKKANTNIYINRAQYSTTKTENLNPASSIYYQVGSAAKDLYHLKDNSKAINTGTSSIDGVDIPEYDADYTRRIKDCEIDMGAYEYNGSYAIQPDITTYPGATAETGDAIYYVTPNGMGVSSASNPANAACAGKLQEVLDAAGRYKFQNPGKRVIVKVANSYALSHAASPEDFQYSATRTTNDQDQNSRIWSIMIPHGVEVWGGYTDVNPTSHLSTDLTNTPGENGFYKKSTQADVDAGLATGPNQTIDARDITGNLTVFSGYFHNSAEGSDAQSYHVVTFTDRIYDPEGKPYLKGDAVTGSSSYNSANLYTESDFKHMSDEKTLINADNKRDQHRAVIDGIYLTGGNANGEENAELNHMGGAAIVTDFAQVRNCIIDDNEAHNGGGLAVLQRGLVSGTLLLNNTAELGGAIYIVPNGTEIAPTLVGSWGTTTTPMVTVNDEGQIINDTDAPAGKSMGWNMSHIFTTTIVANTATKQGGGIYYANEGDPNTRVNSSVLWNNDAPDQANVAGIVNPDKPDDNTASTLTFYPFGYSAIQNVRASGTNNIKVESEATRGVRWSDLDADPWYGISDYSVLTRTGMPVNDYDDVVNHYNVAHIDFKNVDRDIATMAARSFIDMGARAVDKTVVRNELMLRLFVANGEIDNDAVNAMQGINTVKGSVGYDANKAYYAQEGSSFAFPMQHLQDALDYIYWARSETSAGSGVLNQPYANNLPFEIVVAKGTYFPTRDLQGNYGESTANTFLIPEGVSIVGGFDYDDAFEYDGNGDVSSRKFYGRYNELDEIKTPAAPGGATYYIADNVKAIDNTDDITIDGYTIVHKSLNEMKANRAKADINSNNIIEPWEFLNETVLDGDAVNSTHARVYHVLTAYPDESLVGALPTRSIERNTITYNYDSGNPDEPSLKYLDREEGQVINLNGLTVMNGEAYNYIPGSLDEMSAYGYYHGGALFVDGNRYLDQWNKKNTDNGNGWSTTGKTRYMHQDVSNAVGYRDIPVAISQCKFVNNVAGYGGAISTNTTVDIFNSSFEQNMAKSGTEKITFNSTKYDIQFPGQGGAVYSTHQFSAFNTIFANNEAIDTKYQITPQKYQTLRTQDASKATAILGGTGGAIYSGRKGQFHLVNCNLVRNMANAYPAVFTMNPNYAALRDPAGVGATITTPYYNQFVNCIVWGNDINNGMKKYDSNDYFKFASRLICNYGNQGRDGADYEPEFAATKAPQNQTELDENFEETAWFSAYEDGKGVTQNNTYDFRSADYRPYTHAYIQLSTYDPNGLPSSDPAYTPYPYQNCNISIDASNESLEGPNFISPSVETGYAGYMESADWSPARLNKMTDMGSGKIKQIITVDGENYTSVFPTYRELEMTVPVERGLYSNETIDDVITAGAYTMTRFMDDYRNYNENLPLGKEFYMESANSSHQQLYRISYDPNPTHNQTFIDIGVYEYPHTELKWTTEGDEVDILWVSAAEKPENGLPEGSDWSQPTSDLQRAIETLLSSRNGHRKEIRLMDGTFAPIYSINDHLSFYIDTKMMNASVMMPMQYELDGFGNIKKDSNGDPIVNGVTEGLGIKSFTIKGGYSSELKNMYDVDLYPAVFRGQRRTNGTSDTWDHLFYINDATQRYGYQNDAQRYAYGNQFGWQGRGGTTGITTPSVIPIEIDGVTLVNNQALANSKGAAIYYADQKFKEINVVDEHGDPVLDEHDNQVKDIVRADDGDILAIAPQPVNIRNITQYWEDDNNPHTTRSDVPTMYYTTDDANPFVLLHPAKFVMSKSKVMNSGTHYESGQDIKTTSAVYIGREGGDAIFYNNVFHSNWGDPLDAYAAKLINNTFALNKGMVKLTDYQGKDNGVDHYDAVNKINVYRTNPATSQTTDYISLAYNNIFWENGVAVDGVKQQFLFKHIDESTFDGKSYDALTSVGSFFKNNAYTTNPAVADFTAYTDYEKVAGKELYDHYFNVGLVNDNEDVINGPNFVAPKLSAVTPTDIESRDFSLRPSLRLLNKGDDLLYTDGVRHNADKVMTFTPAQSNNVYDMAWLTTMGLDAASNKRKHFEIDLGAYEYQNKLERVIYVNPNNSTTGVGNSWGSPIGMGNLQPAIDLAAVYAVNNEGKEAYVLVKGAQAINKDLHTGETITLRNGVHIYGGIDPQKNDDAPKNSSDEYEDETLHTYINNLKAERLGIADMLGFKTRVSGIRTSSATRFNPTDDHRQSIVDGFIVTPNGEATAPAIDVNPNSGAKVAMRNIIVSDFDLSGQPSLNVANVDNALLYEALFRDNNVEGSMAVLNMGANGYGVNLTVDGLTTGTTANIKNSLYNFSSDVRNTFSGYSYPIDDKNLNYQLAEGSKAIDACPSTVPTLPDALQGFINYSTDRDLLGNPRILALGSESTNTLDAGAFETWKVAKDTWTNTNSGEYFGNYYPHAGSVVYIEEDMSLISAHDFVPGYLLVKNGASLYGNGYDVKTAYVAIERNINKVGNVVSLPYSMDYKAFDNVAKAGVATTEVNATTGVLTQDPFAGKNVYRYDGSERADWQYTFAKEDSKCWKDASGIIPANEGILYIPNADATTKVRFTGRGNSMNDYIYTESGVSKEVILTQYNDGGRSTYENGNTDDKANFTEKEDMGWNAIGLPYLVSQYKPYERVNASTAATVSSPTGTEPYRLHIPHTLWMWYDGEAYRDGTTKADGDGGFYSVNSWDDSNWHMAAGEIASIWVGEGFFTQTATLADDGKETIIFYRPEAPAPGGGGSVKTERWYITDEIREMENDGKEIIDIRYYTPDGMQHAKPVKGVTIQVDIYSDGTQKSHKYLKR